MAAGLAAAAYAEQVQPQLLMRRITRDMAAKTDDRTPGELAVGKNVSQYLQRIGFGPNG